MMIIRSAVFHAKTGIDELFIGLGREGDARRRAKEVA